MALAKAPCPQGDNPDIMWIILPTKYHQERVLAIGPILPSVEDHSKFVCGPRLLEGQ